MLGLQRIEVGGKRFVLLEETEYERLCGESGQTVADDDALPPYPVADASGRFPALSYTRIQLARNLIRERRALGLSQERLAKLAGVRQETLSRLEAGKHTASALTIDKLERALAAKRKRRPKARAARGE